MVWLPESRPVACKINNASFEEISCVDRTVYVLLVNT